MLRLILITMRSVLDEHSSSPGWAVAAAVVLLIAAVIRAVEKPTRGSYARWVGLFLAAAPTIALVFAVVVVIRGG